MSSAMSRLLSMALVLTLMKFIECSSDKRIGSFNAFQKIEAEDYSFANYSTVCQGCEPPTVYLCNNHPEKTVGYYSVDFGLGAVKVTFRIHTWHANNTDHYLNLHLDTAESPPFASYALLPSGADCVFPVVSGFLQTIPTGFHDLYFTFVKTESGNDAHIDWFYFEATSGNQTIFDAFEIIEAEDFNNTKVAVAKVCPGTSVSYMGSLKADTVIAYYGVNFGSGAQMVQIRMSSWDRGTLYLHLDSALNEPFATIAIQKVGPDVDTCNFIILEEFVSTIPTGVHDLYLTVELPVDVEDFVNIDWISFKMTAS